MKRETSRFVGIGDLVADVYYDKNIKLIGADGGITSHNIVCNLQNMGFNTMAFGVCGNDFLGRLATKSLTDCNVKNDIVIRKDIKTKTYHIRRVVENGGYAYRSIKYCPYCKESSWYDGSYIDERYIINNIRNDDILIFDNLNDKNQYIVDNSKNIKLLDLGGFSEFENIDKDEITNKINNKFKIVNLNERVEEYLLNKLECKNSIELSKIFNSQLIIITRGKRGNEFIFKGKSYRFPIKNVVKEVDDSGAGDMFLSIIIKNWYNNNMIIKEEFLNDWFNETLEPIKRILRLVGSRRHIKKLYQIKKKDICNN